MSEINEGATGAKETVGELAKVKALLHEIGNSVLCLSEEFQDEGDRIYLGSTNDAEIFRRLGAKYWSWRIDNEPR